MDEPSAGPNSEAELAELFLAHCRAFGRPPLVPEGEGESSPAAVVSTMQKLLESLAARASHTMRQKELASAFKLRLARARKMADPGASHRHNEPLEVEAMAESEVQRWAKLLTQDFELRRGCPGVLENMIEQFKRRFGRAPRIPGVSPKQDAGRTRVVLAPRGGMGGFPRRRPPTGRGL